MMLGTAMYNAQQTGLEKQQVQEKLATLAVYREGINAFSPLAVAEAEESPGGLLMPNQSLLYTQARPCVLGVGADDAYHPGSLRRADLRNAGLREFHQPRNRAVAPKVLYD